MKTLTQKKITLATLKKFILDNKDNLYSMMESDFDGMTDCVQEIKSAPKKVDSSTVDFSNKNTLGISSIWLVGSSRDGFRPFEDDVFEGIKGYNCCGSWRIARIK